MRRWFLNLSCAVLLMTEGNKDAVSIPRDQSRNDATRDKFAFKFILSGLRFLEEGVRMMEITKAQIPNQLLTLVIIMKDRQVLLGMKKRGFGKGKWNGFGGKVQDDEEILDAAKRETLEECCLEVLKMEHIGKIIFEFVGEKQLMEVHVYVCDRFIGTPKETEEMLPRWFDMDEIPFHDMWPDDIMWYELLFKRQKFEAYFLFEGHDKILSHEINKL